MTILTNASHFTPERAARLETLGRFRYIGVNLPTLDPERYFQLHGTKDLARVLANVDAMHARSLAEETAIVVLGDEDDAHRRDVEQITPGSSRRAGRSSRSRSAAGRRAGRTCRSPRPRRGCAVAS